MRMTQDSRWLAGWLDEPWPDGPSLVGGCDANGQTFTRVLGVGAQLEGEAWESMSGAVAQLAAYGCGNGRSSWIFDTVIMWVARRVDGAWAGVFAPRDASEATRAAIKSRLASFLAA
jgi:hypothetical protein